MRERPSVWLRAERFCAKRRQRPPRRVRAHGAAGDAPCPCEYRHGRRAGRGGRRGAARESERGAAGDQGAPPLFALSSAGRVGVGGSSRLSDRSELLVLRRVRRRPGRAVAPLWVGAPLRAARALLPPRPGLGRLRLPRGMWGCGSGKTKTTLGGRVGRDYSSFSSMVNV